MSTLQIFFTINRLTHDIPSPFPAPLCPFCGICGNRLAARCTPALLLCTVQFARLFDDAVLSTSAVCQFLPGWFPVQKLGSAMFVIETKDHSMQVQLYLKCGYTNSFRVYPLNTYSPVQDVSLGSCQAMGRRWGDQRQSPQVGTCH